MTSNTTEVHFEYTGLNNEDVPKNITHIQLHPSVIELYDNAFEYLTQLRVVVLNEGLQKIGDMAFCGCKLLESITLPCTLTQIGMAAFSGCSSLREGVLNEGLQKIGDCAFQYCHSLQSIAIPSTVDEISSEAFKKCSKLKEVVLNDGLKKIEDGAFQQCTSLERITIPSTVIEIERYAFAGTKLKELVLHEGLKTIAAGTFNSCSSLERITIPSTVNDIDSCAFAHCTSLRDVLLHENIKDMKKWAFSRCTLNRFSFPGLSARLDSIIRSGQIDIKVKIDQRCLLFFEIDGISSVERDGSELFVTPRAMGDVSGYKNGRNWKTVKECLDEIVKLIAYYEMKEATTVFELALWKARFDQADDAEDINRDAYRIEVPGPVQDTILQYISNE